MKVFVILYLLAVVCSAYDVLPGENWESGYIDINPDESMFYILIKARQRPDTPKALVLYLNGGPGTATISNIFFENGPWLFDEFKQFNKNPYSWNNEFDILYVDNPISAGLSVSYKSKYYYSNKQNITNTLYTFLVKFYASHQHYKGVPFIASGMSFAGHYISPLSECLIKAGMKNNKDYINYKATILFAPLLDYTQMEYDAEFLYENKNFTFTQYALQTIYAYACRVYVAIDKENAYNFCLSIWQKGENDSHVVNVYNIMLNRTYHDEFDAIKTHFNSNTSKAKLGSRKDYQTNNYTVRAEVMKHDWLTSQLNDLAFVLDNDVPILFAYGDKDLIMNYKGGYHSVESINWKGRDGFKNAEWAKAKFENKEFGKMKQSGKLRYYLMYNAGHFISKDQSAAAHFIVNSFINEVI